MKPTDVLKEEHRGVKLSLRILEQVCKKIHEENPGEREMNFPGFARRRFTKTGRANSGYACRT